jgi:hypothetical protein
MRRLPGLLLSLVIVGCGSTPSPTPGPTVQPSPSPTPGATASLELTAPPSIAPVIPTPTPTPSPTPKFVSPEPGGSPACGSYVLTVVNEDPEAITASVNSIDDVTVESGTSQVVALYSLPRPDFNVPPWFVVVSRADNGAFIGNAFITGHSDQKLIVSGGQLEYGPYPVADAICPTPVPIISPQPTPSPPPAPPGYSVHIAKGLHPKWTAEAAAADVYAEIKGTERLLGHALAEARIISVEAMAGRDVPHEFSGPYRGRPIIWIVQAQGTFSASGPGVTYWGTDGFSVFDDQGELLTWGCTC